MKEDLFRDWIFGRGQDVNGVSLAVGKLDALPAEYEQTETERDIGNAHLSKET